MKLSHIVALTLLLCLTILACGSEDEGTANSTGAESFRVLLPQRDLVERTMPGPKMTGAPETSTGRGEWSFYYGLARGSLVNDAAITVVELINEIARQEPTEIDQATATWTTDKDAMSPISWRLVIDKKSSTSSSWQLETKKWSKPVSAFEVYARGTHATAEAPQDPAHHTGEGNFTVNSSLLTLPGFPSVDGASYVVSAQYSHTTKTAPRRIDFDLLSFTPPYGEYFRTVTRYSLLADGTVTLDRLEATGSTPPPVASSIHTYRFRLKATGAGRMDFANIFDGSRASECWNAEGKSSFSGGGEFVLWGIEANDCVFVLGSYVVP